MPSKETLAKVSDHCDLTHACEACVKTMQGHSGHVLPQGLLHIGVQDHAVRIVAELVDAQSLWRTCSAAPLAAMDVRNRSKGPMGLEVPPPSVRRQRRLMVPLGHGSWRAEPADGPPASEGRIAPLTSGPVQRGQAPEALVVVCTPGVTPGQEPPWRASTAKERTMRASTIRKAMGAGLVGTLVQMILVYGVTPVMLGRSMDLAALLGAACPLGLLLQVLSGSVGFPLGYVSLASPSFPGPPVLKGMLWAGLLWGVTEGLIAPWLGAGVGSAALGGLPAALRALLGYLAYGATLGSLVGAAGPGLPYEPQPHTYTMRRTLPGTCDQAHSGNVVRDAGLGHVYAARHGHGLVGPLICLWTDGLTVVSATVSTLLSGIS